MLRLRRARVLAESKGIVMKTPFPKAIHFIHEEPANALNMTGFFSVPLFFGSHMSAFLLDEVYLSFKLPRPNPQIMSASRGGATHEQSGTHP